ncbi:MAG: cupredoxin domain-containing protein [Actinobacteria bacterium]|nr:cupredoxin domain-containing protein [Actinomycetota bacterium]
MNRIGCLVFVVMASACQGTGSPNVSDDATQSPAAPRPSLVPAIDPNVNCSPEGTELSISARGSKFNTGCLAAPADTSLRIVFENLDEFEHNIGIHDEYGLKTIFHGDRVTGPGTVSYELTPLAKGKYLFHCDVHPSAMKGTLIIT